MIKVLGIGDYGATNTPGDSIRTFSLGSCVAVILLHPQTMTVGMVHIALPSSHIESLSKINYKTGHFADTGVPALIRLMLEMGCRIPARGGFTVKMAGGANVLKTKDTFQIGKRNVLAAKKILWAHGLAPIAEDIGGTISRTVTVHADTGNVVITSAVKGEWTL